MRRTLPHEIKALVVFLHEPNEARLAKRSAIRRESRAVCGAVWRHNTYLCRDIAIEREHPN